MNTTKFIALAERTFKWTYIILGVISLLWTLLFIVYHFYLTSVFGFNPTQDNPSYTDFSKNNLILNFNHFFTWFWIVCMWCAVYIFPTVLVTNFIFKFIYKVSLNFKIMLFSLVSCSSILLILNVPVIQKTFGWLLD